MHAYARRNREGGTSAALWNSCLFFTLMWWLGWCTHTHTTSLLWYICASQARFQREFSSTSPPLSWRVWAGKGGAGQEWRSRGVSHERRRCDHRGQHRHRSWLGHGQKDRLSSCFCSSRLVEGATHLLQGLQMCRRMFSRAGAEDDQILFPPPWKFVVGSGLLAQKTKPRCDFYWFALSFGACKWGWCPHLRSRAVFWWSGRTLVPLHTLTGRIPSILSQNMR